MTMSKQIIPNLKPDAIKKGYDIAAIPLNITSACCFSVYDRRKMFRLTLMLRRFGDHLVLTHENNLSINST